MKLDAIGIVCKDLKKSVEFYRLLGIDFPEPNGDHLEAHCGGLRVMLDSEELAKKLNPNWIRPVGQRISLAFLCDSPRYVDEAFAKIVSAGHRAHQKPWDAFWGERFASVLDPDGNSVDLFAPL